MKGMIRIKHIFKIYHLKLTTIHFSPNQVTEITIKVRKPISVRNTVLSTNKLSILLCNDFPHESTIINYHSRNEVLLNFHTTASNPEQ